jgi:hypothetical protein
MGDKGALGTRVWDSQAGDLAEAQALYALIPVPFRQTLDVYLGQVHHDHCATPETEMFLFTLLGDGRNGSGKTLNANTVVDVIRHDTTTGAILPGRFSSAGHDDLFCWGTGTNVSIARTQWPPPNVTFVSAWSNGLTFKYAPPQRPYGAHLEYHFAYNGVDGPVVNADTAGTVSIPGLTPSTAYHVEVRAFTTYESSPRVAFDVQTAPPPLMPPAAPCGQLYLRRCIDQ